MAGLRSKERKPNSSDRLKKAQLSFYPEPEDYERLKRLSAETGIPQQVYLRRGLDFVLQTSGAVVSSKRVSQVRQQTRVIMSAFSDLTEKFEALVLKNRAHRRRG